MAFEMTAGDTAPPLDFELADLGTNLDGAAVVFFMWPRAGGALVIDGAAGEVVADADLPTLRKRWAAGETDLPAGLYRVAWRVTFADDTVRHFRPDPSDVVSILPVPV